MQRPVSQDETLDTNDVKNSSLQASNGKNMATLRAYDAIALEVNKYFIRHLRSSRPQYFRFHPSN